MKGRRIRAGLSVIAMVMCSAAIASARASHSTAASPWSWNELSKHGGSVPWNIVVLLTVLTVLPALLLSMTPFVRLLVIFHFLRQALGTQSTPSNQTLIRLALVLTYFLMQPVGVTIHETAIQPFEQGRVDDTGARAGDKYPRRFLLRYAREKDLALFLELAHQPRPARPDDVPMRSVVPAYILSELKVGFQVGAASVYAVSRDRPGGRGHHDLDWHVAVTTGGDFDPVEDSAVCAGRWLELAGGIFNEKLFLRRRKCRRTR